MSLGADASTTAEGEARRALGKPLPRDFYDRPVTRVARDLIGRMLVHDTREGRVAGVIVEVEAYRGEADPASHAFRGRTRRNAVMFGEPGHAYVYFTYGMHHCLNLVTGRDGVASAVLLRAAEPRIGIEIMRRRRGVPVLERLARGPGCLAQAFGLDLTRNGLDVTQPPLWVSDRRPERLAGRIGTSSRVGIRVATERPWRFFVRESPFVSGPRGGLRR
ncbi:MAG TPA: DNA-3-methyladenine glycosylase [Candidatus Eisenbacteria bacterium]|nr:DNA-3-methyladenine glycosylase [Candidatus Eisenbacteria bacterium]